MRHHRGDVVERAINVLDTYGLADLTMRRLGAELGVQPSALYHHFPNKQSLLAAVADELLDRGSRQRTSGAAWDDDVVAICVALRESMLAYRDGAELVSTVHAFGLGAAGPGRSLTAALARVGLGPRLVDVGARTLLHYVFGHAVDEQTQLQAGSAGAIDAAPRDSNDFEVGLALVLDGLRARVVVHFSF